MDNPYKIQAEEWFERATHDIETAKLIFDQGGYTDTIAHLLQQGIEKCLKALLALNEIEPPKIHDLKVLLNRADNFLKSSEDYYDACLRATKYYIEGRYPPGPVAMPTKEEIETVLTKAFSLMSEVKEIIDER